MILSSKRITKSLIRLRGCAGWSAPLLFANLRRQVFLRRGPYNLLELFSKGNLPILRYIFSDMTVTLAPQSILNLIKA